MPTRSNADEFDLVILLTGVGTRALVAVVERVRGQRESFVQRPRRTKVVARGPKPVAVLRELEVPAWLTAPEPNTWREVLAALDDEAAASSPRGPARGRAGVRRVEPRSARRLEARGASVTRVPVYQWALPEDLAPLEAGVRAIADGQIDVVLFTTATQVVHLLQGRRDDGAARRRPRGLDECVVASIGPTTSEEMREQGIEPDLEPTHPKMGFLVREAAERAGAKSCSGSVEPPSGCSLALRPSRSCPPASSAGTPRPRAVDHIPARLRLDAQQPRGLWDGELKSGHFVEFSPNPIDERSHVHGVLP